LNWGKNGLSHPQFNPPAISKSLKKSPEIGAKFEAPTTYKPSPTKKLKAPVELGYSGRRETSALMPPPAVIANAESVPSISPGLPRESAVVASGLWPDTLRSAPAAWRAGMKRRRRHRESFQDERSLIWAKLVASAAIPTMNPLHKNRLFTPFRLQNPDIKNLLF
jgi:hypothetical protein